MRSSTALAALALVACSSELPREEGNLSSEALSSDQKALDEVADRCGLDRKALQVREGGELHFMPPPDSTYEAVDCALLELKKFGNKYKLGFVGTEAYAKEGQ